MEDGWIVESEGSPEVAQNPSNLQKAGQFLGGLATQALKAPFNIPSAVAQGAEYLGLTPTKNPIEALNVKGPSQIIRDIPEQIQQTGEKLFGNIEPENVASKALQYTASNWPFLFAGGIPGAGKVGADIAGSLGMAIAEKATDNPLVGIGAHILGQRGFNKVANLFNSAKKEPGKIGQYISHLYESEKDLGSKIPVKSDTIIHKLDKINDQVHKEYLNPGKFDEAARNRVIKNIQNVERAVSNPKLTASDLSAEKRLLNNAYASKDSIENKYYKQIRSLFADELDELADKHSKWGNAYKTADELYRINRWQSGLGRWAEDLSSQGKLGGLVTNPLAQSTLGLMAGLYKGTPTGIAVGVAPTIAKLGIKSGEEAIRAGKFVNSLAKSQDGRKLLMNIVADSAKENASALTKNIHKLNKAAEKWEIENPEDQNNGWTIES